MIDLEFDTASQASAWLAAMRVVWGRVEGTIMTNPQARIVEAMETKEYWVQGSLYRARGQTTVADHDGRNVYSWLRLCPDPGTGLDHSPIRPASEYSPGSIRP